MDPRVEIFDNTVILSAGTNDEIMRCIGNVKPKKIILRSGDWSNAEFLKAFESHLIHLEIGDESFDWSILPELSFIERLSIGGWFKCDIDFDKMQSLQYLSTYWNEGYDQRLFGAKKLKALSIQGFKFPNLDELSRLESLEYLNVLNSRTLISTQGIEKLTSLRRLYLLNCSALYELTHLKNNAVLESLRLENCKKLDSIDGIFECTYLKELNLFNLGGLASLEMLKQLISIKWLVFDTKVSNGDLSFIYELPNLNMCVFKNKKNYSIKSSIIEAYLQEKGRFNLSRFSEWYAYSINKDLPSKL